MDFINKTHHILPMRLTSHWDTHRLKKGMPKDILSNWKPKEMEKRVSPRPAFVSAQPHSILDPGCLSFVSPFLREGSQSYAVSCICSWLAGWLVEALYDSACQTPVWSHGAPTLDGVRGYGTALAGCEWALCKHKELPNLQSSHFPVFNTNLPICGGA